MTSATMSSDDRYTIISADCHAGGSHEMYREYLEPEYLDDFDAWREQVQEPVPRPPGRRPRPQLGRRAPHRRLEEPTASSPRSCSRTPCRRSSRASSCSPGRRSPSEYEHRLAGIRAHNRWLADWCGRFPERRAGIGQIFLNDVDDAIDDVQLDQGARPARRRAHLRDPARRRLREAALRPASTTRCGRCARTSACPVNSHGGTGLPDYGKYPVADAALHHRGAVLLAAAVRAAAALGRVRALPEPEVRDDRDGLRVDAADAAALRPRARADPQDRPHRRAALLRGAHPAEVGDRVLPRRTAGSA